MALTSVTQLHTASEDNGYIRRYYSTFKQTTADGRKLSRAQLTVLGAILSYSNVKGKPDALCQLSYSSFEKQYRVSRASIARAISTALDAGIITQDKSNPAHASYKYIESNQDQGYIVTENYLYKTKFAVKGEAEPRYLTRSAIDVLSLIKTHCENKKGNGKFRGSVRGIMSTLNLSKRTVQKAISLLLAAELIFRPDRGINSHFRSEFTVNKKLLRTVRKQYRKENAALARRSSTENNPEWIAAADAKADRDRFYAARRHLAEAPVEQFQRQLDADKRYHELDVEQRKLTPHIARLEVAGEHAKAEECKRKQKSLKVQMARRMEALGISSDDLKPVYECNLCNDTGVRVKDHRMCDCYQSPRRRQK